MKKLLGLVAAGLLVATPAYIAMADSHEHTGAAVKAHAAAEDAAAAAGEAAASATDAANEAAVATEAAEKAIDAAGAAAEVAAEVTMHEAPLADGTVVHFEGDAAFVTNEKGEKVAAPDGDHTLADGSTLTVKDGKVTAGLPVKAEMKTEVEVKTPEEGAVEATGEVHTDEHGHDHEEKAAE